MRKLNKEQKTTVKMILTYIRDVAMAKTYEERFKNEKMIFICNSFNRKETMNKFNCVELYLTRNWLMTQKPTKRMNKEFAKSRFYVGSSAWWDGMYKNNQFEEVMKIKQEFLNHIIAKL